MSKNNGETYAYIKIISQFYWVEKQRFFSPANTGNNLMLTAKELNEARVAKEILEYDNITYRRGGLDGCLNLLNEDSILKPSSTPVLDGDIKQLIDNVAGYKEMNIEYLHRSILYKHANINDFTIPSIVFAGKGGSGKGTFISLLGTIFGEENVLANLGQRELVSSFDTYKGRKLIVEFAEVTTNNTQGDKKILNKLKNMIGAREIIVNEKGVQSYAIDNIAWFFISSNSNKPLQLDDKDKGNRRFSVILSDHKLENGERINISIKDKEKVGDYLAWLYQTYPDVLNYKKVDALDNQDKRDLEERSQEDANSFWEWVEGNYPDFRGKKNMEEIEVLIEMFCTESSLNQREFMRFFWHNSRYTKKKIRIGDRTFYGVEIP